MEQLMFAATRDSFYRNITSSQNLENNDETSSSLALRNRLYGNDDINEIGAEAIVGSNSSTEMYATESSNFMYSAFQTPPDESSVELMAQFAADLANVSSTASDVHYVDEQRLLMHSTMSPLLAAVNDITKRDAIVFESNQELHTACDDPVVTPQTNKLLMTDNSFVEGNYQSGQQYEKSTCLVIADKRVICRAKATLPTEYLQFGEIDATTNEPSILAKFSIPHCTLFGPFEGENLYVSEIDLDVLNMQTPRHYPLLMLKENLILDVDSENSSNWMRYIRLAETYTQQNLHLVLENDKIYFRSTRIIDAHEELRVGYHNSYAERFCLYYLQPPINEDSLQKENLYFNTAPVHIHPTRGSEHLLPAAAIHVEPYSNVRQTLEPALLRRHAGKTPADTLKTSSANNNSTTRCKICLKLFMTPCSLKAHLKNQHQHTKPTQDRKCSTKKTKSNKKRKSSKSTQNNEAKAMYKCHLCAKRFSTPDKYELHKTSHGDKLSKPFKCSICQQQCATATALSAHVHSHTNSLYTCIYCNQKFKYVRDFKKHVEEHKTQDNTFECQHCKKNYTAYYLARKHVRLFHMNGRLTCDQCDKIFKNISTLQRHKLTHATKNLQACNKCNYKCRRKDQLTAHMKRVHTGEIEKESARKESHTKVATISNNVTNSNSEGRIEDTQKGMNEKLEKSISKGNFLNDGSQYLKLSPCKPKLSDNALSSASSASNRRKQTPTKLKTVDLNSETVTYMTLSDMLPPFLISEQELHEEFEKSDNLYLKRISNAEEMMESKLNKVNQNMQANNMEDKHTTQSVSKKVVKTFADAGRNSASNRINKQSALKDHQKVACDSNKNIFINDEINPLYPFKCHLCRNATRFKRRGILVNHFAKMHPEVNLSEIDVLNKPVIKPQLIFPCPCCAKVYKSNAKRKAHLIKNHPEHEVKDVEAETVGNIESDIHKCELCPRQYVARNRLVSHYRKMHSHIADIPKHAQHSSEQIEFLEPEININISYQQTPEEQEQPDVVVAPETAPLSLPAPFSPENKLLKLSSAALELSRFDFLNERTSDDINRLPILFEESPLDNGIDTSGFIDKYNHRSIELQFFEKIGKL